MNIIKHSQRPQRNIVWHALPFPKPCEHPYEVIAHEAGGALKRYVHCGSLEAR